MVGSNKEREFIAVNKSTPLGAFVDSKSFSAEKEGNAVAFTFGPDVTFIPEGSKSIESLAGKRGLISYLDLKIMHDAMIPAVIEGKPGKLHPHHQITPEEALVLKEDFHIALGMAEILKADRSGPQDGTEPQ